MAGLHLSGTEVRWERRWPGWLWRRPAADAQALGQRGEDLAYWFLRRQGYTIVARNHRAASRKLGGAGEIDLIAFEGVPAAMVFVEVKTRSREGKFATESAVNAAKRRHLLRAARGYRRRRHYTGPYRFDVVVVEGPEEKHPRLRLHRDAFRDTPAGEANWNA